MKNILNNLQKEWNEAVSEVSEGHYLSMIGKLSPFRFAEVQYHYMTFIKEEIGHYYLIKDPRIVIS